MNQNLTIFRLFFLSVCLTPLYCVLTEELQSGELSFIYADVLLPYFTTAC